MPPSVKEIAPDFEALLCNDETFRPTALSGSVGSRGGVLVFDGFVFSAIVENWWTRYATRGWGAFDGVPVYGIVRDGPYSINEFLRQLDSPFSIFSDLGGEVADAYELLVERDGMAGTETSRRAVFVLDENRVVRHAWVADGWTEPVPVDEVEAAIDEL